MPPSLKTAALLAAVLAWPALAAGPAEYDWFAKLKLAESAMAQQTRALADPALTEQARESLKQQMMGPLQEVAMLQAFVGDSAGALNTFDSSGIRMAGQPVARPPGAAPLTASVAVDAIAAIVSEARTRQIVILNEAHHVPMHRAFAMALARELKKIGYTYLACETFSPEPLGRGYIAQGSGHYLNEPVFANFLREAQKDNWKFVPYENERVDPSLPFADQIRLRELGQVNNLQKRVLAKDPNAKIFMYVGYSHAAEQPEAGSKDGIPWMAAYLKQRTGIDPLTIDQTTMMAHEQPVAHAWYADLVQLSKSGMPFVLRGAQGYDTFGQFKDRVDMQVIHPPYPIAAASGRPAWLAALAHFEARPIPKELWPVSGRRVIYVRRKGGAADEVPVDAILAVAGARPVQVMAPPGELVFSVQD